MNSRTKPAIVSFIAAVFIFLFTYTAVSKLTNVPQFELTLAQSPLLSQGAPVLAVLVPIVEIGTVIFLAIPRFRKYGLWGSLSLLTLFTIYISYMLITASRLPCSCGGVIKQLSWNQHLILNLVCMALAAIAIYITTNKKSFHMEGVV